MKVKKQVFFLLTAALFCSCSFTISNGASSTPSPSNTPTSGGNDEWKPYEEAIIVSDIKDEHPYVDDNPHYVVQTIGDGTKEDEVRFFEINDTHGALNSENDISGMDRIQTLMKDLQAKNGDYIGILGGDIFQGGWLSNQTYGGAFVDIINQMNFNCFVLGNHEFDWGLEKIAAYKDSIVENGELNIPFLAANVYYANTDLHPSWLDPFTIVEQGGHKVGIIGIIGEGQYSSISTDKRQNFEFKNTYKLIQDYSTKLHDELNCDIVVLAAHSYDTTFNQQIAELSFSKRIDAIFCGHTHQAVEEVLTGWDDRKIPVIQSYTKNINAGTITLDVSQDKFEPTLNHYWGNAYECDSAITTALEKYKDIIEEGAEVIGTTPQEVSRAEIGEMATEHMAKYYNVSAAIINTQGVRASIVPGDINRAKILEVFPFDNRILLVQIKGVVLNALLKNNGYYKYYDSSERVDEKQTYVIAVIDFVYTNSSSKTFFNNSMFKETGDFIRDDFIRAIKEKF